MGYRKLGDTKSLTRIGTAGWSIPKSLREFFPGEDSLLERYARVLNAVEINSSFYRNHEPKTYERWARSVPDDFRFSVKLSKVFTHERKLRSVEGLGEVIDGIAALGDKWGVLLVQLPPKLEFEEDSAEDFFRVLAELSPVPIALEPRHQSWASPLALDLLEHLAIAKVRADPERVSIDPGLRERVEPFLYYRLHGTPEIYKSAYSRSRVEGLRRRIEAAEKPAWVVFDNTTFGAATENALQLTDVSRQLRQPLGKNSRLVLSADS